MKCLSLRQPWASLIASGRKTIEVRSWRTHYRGPLVICASARPRQPPLPSAAAVCLVELIDVRPLAADDLPAACLPEIKLEGLFAWVLSGAVPLSEPFGPIRGRLKLFDPPAELRELCRPLLSARESDATPLIAEQRLSGAKPRRCNARNIRRPEQPTGSAVGPRVAAARKAE